MLPAATKILASLVVAANHPMLLSGGWSGCNEPPGYESGTVEWQPYNGRTVEKYLRTPNGTKYPCEAEVAATNNKVVVGGANWHKTVCGPLTIVREVHYGPCEEYGLTGIRQKVNSILCGFSDAPSHRTARYELRDRKGQKFSLLRTESENPEVSCTENERFSTTENKFTVLGASSKFDIYHVTTVVTGKAVRVKSPPVPSL
jgi:hypothetical protein